MKAIKASGGGQATVETDVKIPQLRSDYVTVQTKAVALNPTDWKHRDFMIQAGDPACTLGCDFAGVVHEIGSDVQVSLRKGDRVCGFAHGGNILHDEDGAFGEYLTAKGDLLLRIPDNMSFEDASNFGVGTFTVGQGLYQQMRFPFPGEHPTQGSKPSGFEVLTSCSPRNTDLVKSLGADHVFDYSAPDCATDIRKVTRDNLIYAWDTIGDENTAKICAVALSRTKAASYGSIIPVKCPREDVKCTYSLAYTVLDEKVIKRGKVFEASQDDYNFALEWAQVVQALISEYKLKPARVETRSGGLDALLSNGLGDLKEGRVSGKKLVYTIS